MRLRKKNQLEHKEKKWNSKNSYEMKKSHIERKEKKWDKKTHMI